MWSTTLVNLRASFTHQDLILLKFFFKFFTLFLDTTSCSPLNHILSMSIAGSDKQIDVIDVSRQCDLKMRLGDFVEYYNSPNRDRVLNVISLEFSETRYMKKLNRIDACET